MRTHIMIRYALLLLALISPPVFALEELVDSEWLNANRNTSDLFLLDIQQQKYYIQAHITGAINAPYKKWRTDDKSQSPGMLPPVKRMEQFIGELGIRDNNKIIIIATGAQAADMAAASRVFWTLKTMGLQKVAILNGGLFDYAKQYADDLEATPRSRAATSFKAIPNNSIVADSSNVLTALHNGTQLLDTRTLGEYLGVVTAKPNERPGTIPGAKHLPFNWLVDAEGRIRNKVTQLALFRATRLNPAENGTIHFCYTGNRASLNWFVDYSILGNRNAKLYDGSMSEWSIQKVLPMETKIAL